jgi:hypothetical protein
MEKACCTISAARETPQKTHRQIAVVDCQEKAAPEKVRATMKSVNAAEINSAPSQSIERNFFQVERLGTGLCEGKMKKYTGLRMAAIGRLM